MTRRPPRSTRTDTLFPYTTLFRSGVIDLIDPGRRARPRARLGLDNLPAPASPRRRRAPEDVARTPVRQVRAIFGDHPFGQDIDLEFGGHPLGDIIPVQPGELGAVGGDDRAGLVMRKSAPAG